MAVPLSLRYEINYPSVIQRAGSRRYKQVRCDVVAVKNHRTAEGARFKQVILGREAGETVSSKGGAK